MTAPPCPPLIVPLVDRPGEVDPRAMATGHASHELTVVHEDEHLLVLDKPAGLLSVPGRGADKQDCLSARAQARHADAMIVHRLDMATSGLLVMARGIAMQRRLSAAFAARAVRKRYEALVDGELRASAGWQQIDSPIAADWVRRPLRVIDAAGQPSTTRWRVIECLADHHASRVELEPVTGRTHQLRVHMASIGHAILGDALYAPAAVAARTRRLMLHACLLEFEHPSTARALRFESAAHFGELSRP